MTRTKEEIEAEIKKGEEFVKAHPYSMFGDDNRKNLYLFKRITKMFLGGKTLDEIEDIIDDAYDDSDLTHALDCVEWLRGDLEEFY